MHDWLMEQAKCLKMEIEKRGIDNLTKNDLEEAYYFSKIIKNLMCVEKDGKIVEAMEESKNEDNMSAIEMYEDYPERKFYNSNKYSNGRYAPKGRGMRRGYDEPMYYMTPDMYEKYPAEYYRDMDRQTGRMYYTPSTTSSNMGSGNSMNYGGPMGGRDSREGRSGMSRRSYMETKQTHRNDSPEDKNMKARKLDEYMTDLYEDMKEMVHDMSNEEKTVWKQKINKFNQLIQ